MRRTLCLKCEAQVKIDRSSEDPRLDCNLRSLAHDILCSAARQIQGLVGPGRRKEEDSEYSYVEQSEEEPTLHTEPAQDESEAYTGLAEEGSGKRRREEKSERRARREREREREKAEKERRAKGRPALPRRRPGKTTKQR